MSYSGRAYLYGFLCSSSDSDLLCISKAQEREHITYVSSITRCIKYETKGLNKRNLGSRMELCTESEQSRQAQNHNHSLALHSLISSVIMTLHFVPALIWITSYKWEQQQQQQKDADPIVFYCLLKPTTSLQQGGKNKLIAVNTSAAISLHLCLSSCTFID